MPIARWAAVSTLFLLLYAPSLHAQRTPIDSAKVNDTTVVYAVQLGDGGKLVGRITRVTADSVQLVSASATITIARGAVVELREYPISALHKGVLWPENPHSSRLLFAPTAIPLRKGEGYFADFWIFLVSTAYGVTDRFTLGAGGTLFPGAHLDDNLAFLLPKYAVVNRPTFTFSLGALMAHVPWSDSDSKSSNSFGILYGVATKGSRENNLTLGAGWGYHGGELSAKPILTVGGQRRVSKRIALISENWIFPFSRDGGALVTYGVRVLGERMAVDLAFAGTVSSDGGTFPILPLVGLAVKF